MNGFGASHPTATGNRYELRNSQIGSLIWCSPASRGSSHGRRLHNRACVWSRPAAGAAGRVARNEREGKLGEPTYAVAHADSIGSAMMTTTKFTKSRISFSISFRVFRFFRGCKFSLHGIAAAPCSLVAANGRAVYSVVECYVTGFSAASKPAASSAADAYRWSMRFAIARKQTTSNCRSTSGLNCDGGGGSAATTC